MLTTLPKIIDKRQKRLGRGAGSGKGAKSGRGTTRHQKAREDIPIHFEGGQGRFVKKFPLVRGKAKNKSIQLKPLVISLSDLNVFEDGQTVDFQALIEKGFIGGSEIKKGIKILANGTLEKKLTVMLPVSQAAAEMIRKAGGEISTK